MYRMGLVPMYWWEIWDVLAGAGLTSCGSLAWRGFRGFVAWVQRAVAGDDGDGLMLVV